MTVDQLTLFGILAAILALFIYGRWRFDFVALLALLAVTLTGIIPFQDAFLGFAHPAVITVALVLILSGGLQNAGLIDYLSERLSDSGGSFRTQMSLLNGLIAAVSGFMNNIGALAMMMPVTVQLARKQKCSPSPFLMPVAFSAILGGMITLIGTPPNIIVATLRPETGSPPFGMFDFAPVGLGVAVAGVLFLSLIGWRLIPTRKGTSEDLFDIEAYMTELRVPPKTALIGKTVREFHEMTKDDVVLLGVVRNKRKKELSPGDKIHSKDILIVEGEHDPLQQLIDETGVKLLEEHLNSTIDLQKIEAVVQPGSKIVGRKVGNLKLRERFGVQILAVARHGRRVKQRFSQVKLRVGDIILLNGPDEVVQEVLRETNSLPLIERKVRFGEPRRLILSLGIYALAILLAALNVMPIQLSFLLAVVLMNLFGLLKVREIYELIDWPIIVLLGALIPLGIAMQRTGGANLIAEGILSITGGYSPAVVLAVTLIGTMFLSDLVNNATAAVLMVPIAIKIASQLGVSGDPFLMAVAIGASCPFLTPIGHQCNALVMGPGGYRFGDYWRLGLPLEILIVTISMPLLLWFWPF